MRPEDCESWYQTLRPVDSYWQEPSRVELVSLNVNSEPQILERLPWGSIVGKEDTFYGYEEVELSTEEIKKPNDAIDELKIVLKGKVDSVRLAHKGQDEAAAENFWLLASSANPECPPDIDVDAIRALLRERQALLGRCPKDEGITDPFDKYGLGLNARRFGGTSDDAGRSLKTTYDALAKFLDGKVEERIKVPPTGKDLYDKNNPIKGKVRFRRDELGGPPQYTDLDEVFSFGDVDKDTDFRKYLEATGRGRFDSEGNFVLFDLHEESDDTKTKGTSEAGLKGSKTGKRKRRHGGTKDAQDAEGSGRASSASDDVSDGGSSKRRRLDDTKKNRYHPEWDFPACNYPTWVHRMYRMDQVKIGQLVKQGQKDAESPCNVYALDKFWGMKSAAIKRENLLTTGERSLAKAEQDGVDLVAEGQKKKGKRRDLDRLGGPTGLRGHQTDGNDMSKSKSDDSTFDVGAFLKDFHQEMSDVTRNGSEFTLNIPDASGPLAIDKLLEREEDNLRLKEQELRNEIKGKLKQEERLRSLKDRQEAARKVLKDREEKLRQEQQRKLAKLDAQKHDRDLAEKSKLDGAKAQERKSKWDGKNQHGKRNVKRSGHGSNKSGDKTASTFKTCLPLAFRARDPKKDLECMNRFRVLLAGQDVVAGCDLAVRVLDEPLLKYPKKKKRTLCELVEVSSGN